MPAPISESQRNVAGEQVVTNILTQMQIAGYSDPEGFLFCGDYD